MTDPISGATSVAADLMFGVGGAVIALATSWATFRAKLQRLDERVHLLAKRLSKLDSENGRVRALEDWRTKNKGAQRAMRVARQRTGPLSITGTHAHDDEDSGESWPED